VLILFTAPAAYAAPRLIAAWKADQIAALPTELVRLRTKDGVFGVVQRARVAALVDALSRIQAAAGISAELLIVHFSDGSPNAFAKVTDDDKKVVAVTISMLDLIGDDVDARMRRYSATSSLTSLKSTARPERPAADSFNSWASSAGLRSAQRPVLTRAVFSTSALPLSTARSHATKSAKPIRSDSSTWSKPGSMARALCEPTRR
jgi:hypothetical protein